MSSQRQPPTGADRFGVRILIGVALLLTLLNAIKPFHIDDPFLYRIAERIQSQPLDPYGFDIFWLQWPQPVHEELTPPVLPYWWALGIRLLGPAPWLAKLWLFPFVLLFVLALHRLLRGWAPEWALPVTALLALSPAVLPGINMMQDLPAFALGLAALAVYLAAAEKDSLPLAAGAGLLAGLATQTKYTAVSILAVMLLDGLLRRRWRPPVLAGSLALLVFFGWEWAMTARYGQSMFLGQVYHGQFWFARLEMVLPLIRMLGATAPWLAGLVLLARGARSWLVHACSLTILLGYLALLRFPIASEWFTVCGLLLVSLLLGAVVGLVRPAGPGRVDQDRTTDWLLVGWLVIEVGVYFAASPFPAVRRILGVLVAASVLLARWVARERPARDRRSLEPALVGLLACAGLSGGLFYLTDLLEARAQRSAARQAAAWVRGEDSQARIWFVGHWGFQHYAEEQGLIPLVPDVSRLAQGDRLIVPLQVDRQRIRLSTTDVRLEHTLLDDRAPRLTTGVGYYGGSLPLSHRPGPRLETRIYRVLRDQVPASDWSAQQLFQWASTAGGRTAAAAVPALVRMLGQADGESRRLAARGLAQIGPLAAPAVRGLVAGLQDRLPAVRFWSAQALGRLGPAGRPALAALEARRADPDPQVREAVEQALSQLREGN